MIAKKRATLLALHDLIQRNQIKKTYQAVVFGEWRRGKVTLDAPLKKQEAASGARQVRVDPEGKKAVTHVTPVATGSLLSRLSLRLETGRTHQLRVHLADAGFPIVGDDKYGDFTKNREMAKKGIKRLLLHAHVLSFTLAGERVSVEAPLPSAFIFYGDECESLQFLIDPCLLNFLPLPGGL
jgi:23S rRNA pseudouridine955/2504/2580 synthase